jgi:hypothetical protein
MVISAVLAVVLARIGADPFTRDWIRQPSLGDRNNKFVSAGKLLPRKTELREGFAI